LSFFNNALVATASSTDALMNQAGAQELDNCELEYQNAFEAGLEIPVTLQPRTVSMLPHASVGPPHQPSLPPPAAPPIPLTAAPSISAAIESLTLDKGITSALLLLLPPPPGLGPSQPAIEPALEEALGAKGKVRSKGKHKAKEVTTELPDLDAEALDHANSGSAVTITAQRTRWGNKGA
jgi:hypothetical protein